MKRLAWILAVTAMVTANAWSQTKADQALLRLQATQPSILKYNNAAGNLSFLRWQQPLAFSANSHFEKAQQFLAIYGPAFGVDESATSFVHVKEERDLAGNYHLQLQQQYKNIPVFAGTVNFHFDESHALLGLDGVLLPSADQLAIPQLTAAQAVERSRQWTAKHYPHVPSVELLITPPQLEWFKEGLVQGREGAVKLVYYLEVSDRKHLREYLLIDAAEGLVIEYFPGVCDLAERRLFSGTTANPIWEDGDAFPADLTNWQQEQLHTSEEVYYLFKNTFQRISYDNLDGDLLLIDEATFLDCPNASWNGYTTNYCSAISSDDVVGHEWAHAYTEYTSDLLYAWQAGAINEAYSDIWGETIDLLNSPSNENPLRAECADGERWLIGEDAPALGGAIRDLWQPTCYGKPGKVSDPEYFCGNDDFGGVHTNSGVVAHAYALLVDGGNYNGYDIAGLGLDKAAHIFWQAQAYYLGRTSDFSVLADALTAAFSDLRNATLTPLSLDEEGSNQAGVQLTSADSIALQQVIAATELKLEVPCSGYSAALQPDPPAFCLVDGNEFTPFFTEDFEVGSHGWLLSAHPVHPTSWTSRHWTLTTVLPEERPGQGIYARSPNLGHCDTLLNNGTLRLQSPTLDIPDELEGRVYLTFDHYFSLEDGIDGGNVKIQQNGGSWLTIPPAAFLHNPYNELLAQQGQTDNPLAGQRVFTGADAGAVTGTWGTSQIDLTVIGVHPGESIRLRWELGTDGCGGWDGWYLDDIRVGTCAARVLPVEWLSFTAQAQEKSVLLKWVTAAEENNLGFQIERSIDGRTFTKIGFVGAGAPTGSNYQFVDHDLPIGESSLYYRLRQEDLDGSFSYSPLRQVTIDTPTSWTLSPNPANSSSSLNWPQAPFAVAKVSLTDLNGRLIQAYPEWQPDLPLPIDLQRVPTGIYVIRIQTEKTSHSQRLVVQ